METQTPPLRVNVRVMDINACISTPAETPLGKLLKRFKVTPETANERYNRVLVYDEQVHALLEVLGNRFLAKEETGLGNTWVYYTK